MHNPKYDMKNETHKLLWDFEIQTDHLISARRPNLVLVNKKKATWRIVDFTVPVDHRVKVKKGEKRYKYLDLAWELKNLWNMKMTAIPVVIGALGTVTKRCVKWLEDLEISTRMVTIQTTALLRSARILRRVLEIEGTCCHSNSSEKPLANAGGKDSQKSKIIIIIIVLGPWKIME